MEFVDLSDKNKATISSSVVEWENVREVVFWVIFWFVRYLTWVRTYLTLKARKPTCSAAEKRLYSARSLRHGGVEWSRSCPFH